MPDAAKSLLEARRRLLAAALPLAAALGFGPDLLAEAERAARSLFHAPEPTQFRPYRGP